MNKRGFSLLEIICTMMIILMLFSIGIPGITSFLRRTRLNFCLRSVTSAIHLARYTAVEMNRKIYLKVNNNQLVISKKRGSDWDTVHAIPKIRGARISMNASPVFYPTGLIVPLFSVSVEYEIWSYKIAVSFAGRIKVTDLTFQ